MTDNIYIAPDIRQQKLEDAEDFINAKRVNRMIMAEKHRQTITEKAVKLHGKAAEKFNRQVQLFDNAMEKLVVTIEKMDERLARMAELHAELNNLEGVINDDQVN